MNWRMSAVQNEKEPFLDTRHRCHARATNVSAHLECHPNAGRTQMIFQTNWTMICSILSCFLLDQLCQAFDSNYGIGTPNAMLFPPILLGTEPFNYSDRRPPFKTFWDNLLGESMILPLIKNNVNCHGFVLESKSLRFALRVIVHQEP